MTAVLDRPVTVRVADGWEGVRAITVRQPWAEAIADGVKLVENRSSGFPKNHRGLVLLHAAQEWSERGRRDPRILGVWSDQRLYALRHEVAWRKRPPHPFRSSAVVAVMEVVDIHPSAGCCKPWGEDTYPPANPKASPPGQVTHLVFEDVRRLTSPVPASGALGLWKPDPELVAAVRERMPT